MADLDNSTQTDSGSDAPAFGPTQDDALPVRQPTPLPSNAQPSNADLTPPSIFGGQQPTVQNVPLQTPSAPTEAQPSMWQRILTGALAGLAGGAGAKNFGQGVAGGARASIEYNQQQTENQQKQQQLDQVKHFQDAESAFRAASLANQDKQLALQSQEAQDRHDANVMSLIKTNQELFGTTYDAVPNTSQAAMDWINQSKANSGGAGASIPAGTLVTSSTVYVPKQGTNSLEVQYKQATDLASALGLPAPTQQQFNMATPQQRGAIVERYQYQLMGKDPTTMEFYNGQKLPAVISNLQTNIKRYGADPNHNEPLLGIMKNSLADLQSQQQAGNSTPEAKLTLANIAKAQADTSHANAETKKANAETSQLGVQKMLDTGVNPYTNEKLTIDNAPPMMLVDQNTGQPVPLKMMSTLKPTQQESNRADFAHSVLHGLDAIDNLRAANKLPNGPISGVTTKALSKAGLGDKEAQQAMNYISFVQSAATGAHVGGRFSVPVLEKMNQLLSLNMNDGQFQGAEDAIRDVMGQYVRTGGRMTVAEYKQQKNGTSAGTPNASLLNKYAQQPNQ